MHTKREFWRALAGFCLLAFVFHGQAAGRLFAPSGFIYEDFSDVFYTAWAIDWTTAAITHPGQSLFNAPIFFPSSATLAYSEHFIGLGVLTLPVTLLTDDAVTSVQFVLLLSTVFMGVMTFLLIRALGGTGTGAFIGGVIAAFAPARLLHAPLHMHILVLWWIPFCLLCVHRLYETRETKWWWWLGAGIVAQGLCSLHGLLFLLVALTCASIVYGAACDERWKQWSRTAGIMAGSLMLLFPLLIPYLRMSADLDFARPAAERALLAVGLRDFFVPPIFSPALSVEHTVSPGMFPLALLTVMVICVWVAARGVRMRVPPLPLRIATAYGLIGLIGLLLALGPDMHWVRGSGPAVPGLWRFVEEVPGFSGIRAIGRFVQLTVLSIAVLVGVLWHHAAAMLAPQWRTHTAVVVVVLLCAEFFATVPSMPAIDRAMRVPRPVDAWLATMPAGCVVAEVPFDDMRTPTNESTQFMYLSRYHHKQLINGYSGAAPPGFFSLEKEWYRGDMTAALAGIEARGADYLVVHPHLFDTNRGQTIADSLAAQEGLEPVTRFPDSYIFRLTESSCI